MTQVKENYYWFKVEGANFLATKGALDAESLGCLVCLMCVLCTLPHLPKSLSQLKVICRGAKSSSIKQALSFLQETDKGYISPEIQLDKEKVADVSQKRREAGKNGASIRWGHGDLFHLEEMSHRN